MFLFVKNCNKRAATEDYLGYGDRSLESRNADILRFQMKNIGLVKNRPLEVILLRSVPLLIQRQRRRP